MKRLPNAIELWRVMLDELGTDGEIKYPVMKQSVPCTIEND